MGARARWLRRLGVAACLAASLVGCSLIGIAYSNADQWLLHEADEYLDLRDDQRARLRARLRQRLADHRAKELAGYVDFLDLAHRAAADGLTPGEAEGLVERLAGLVRTTVAGTLPPLADVLATLEPAQLDHLQAKLADDDRRYRNDWVQRTAQRRADRRTKTAVGILEYWTGELTAAQRDRVAGLTRAWPDLGTEWFAYRTARTSGLLDLLRGEPDAETIRSYLESRWVTPTGRSATLEAGEAEIRRAVAELVAAVDGSLSVAQRAAMLERIRGYRDELADLLPGRGSAVAHAEAAEAVAATP